MNAKYEETVGRRGPHLCDGHHREDVKLANFLVKTKLPTPPKVFGHQDLIGGNWQMLGNDHYGDCVWAGAAHETMLWNKEADRTVAFNNESVLKDYSVVTGFNPKQRFGEDGTRDAKAQDIKRSPFAGIFLVMVVRTHDWHPSWAFDCADGIKLSHGHAPLSEIRVFIAETAFGLRLFQ